MMKKTLLSLFLVGSVTLTGCSTISDLIDSKPDDQKTVEEFYNSASEAFADKQWEAAIEDYEKLKAFYPYGKYAEQSYLELAYSYYKYDEPESAIRELEEFIRLYPRHSALAYAYYLKAVAADSVTKSWLDKYITDPATRDVRSAERAYEFYQDLIKRFPNSKYAVAASQRLIVLKNQRARHELQVANFYMAREAYLAAANRARTVLTDFPRSASTEDALNLLAIAYDKMGMTDNRNSVLEVYKLNKARLEASSTTLEDMEKVADPRKK